MNQRVLQLENIYFQQALESQHKAYSPLAI